MNLETLNANWIPAVAVNLVLSALAWKSGSIRPSGVVGGLIVGIPIYLFLGWQGFAILGGFFVVGTTLTRMGYARKERMGVAEEKKGARGASHAFANAGVAAGASLLAWLTEAPAWTVLFVGAFATAAMDTAGSEVGPLYGRRTISLKNGRPVPPGTEGAVSLEGTLAGLGAAAALAVLAMVVGLVTGLGAALVVVGAFLGNLYEGILGSRKLLPHTWLNTTNTLVGGGAAALLWRFLG